MTIKKITQLSLLFMVASIASAQEIYLETGKTSSSFDYKNSQDVELDNLEATTNTYMALGYRTNVLSYKLKTTLGAGYHGYGAVGSDEDLEGILKWDANYLEFNLGLDYSLFAINQTEFYIKGIIATGFLVQGTQSINNEIINLKNVDDFNKMVVSFKGGAGLLHPVSRELTFYVQYLFGKTLNQSSKNDNESLSIRSHNIGFGVLIKLFNSNQS